MRSERTLKNLVLIRARHLTESITTPAFLVDNQGDLIFYNEPAETVIGRSFGDQGVIHESEFGKLLNVRSEDGTPLSLEGMAGWGALQKARPGYGKILFSDFRGKDHLISVCAVPLFTGMDHFEGSMVIFWEEDR